MAAPVRKSPPTEGAEGSPALRRGDRVRLAQKLRPFRKVYLTGWTEEVFIVARVLPGPVVTYKITEYDGTPLRGRFYGEELQKVHVDDASLFRIERVLRRRGRRLYVRWKGWPPKYDSWIDRDDLGDVREA